MKKIILFASGSGSNAEKIIKYCQDKKTIEVIRVYTNNPTAKVIERAKNLNVPAEVFSREALNSGEIAEKIALEAPDLIVLAGFLWKFPEAIVKKFPNKIINIHPALLPKYGGKGMYGMNVHQAVLDAKEKETGITIHYVNENYDEGGIIFQKSVNIEDCKTAEEIAEKIHTLEHQYFSEVIEKLLT
jgi:phosphoribosylglycinamide formyltransferase-1